MAGRRVGVVGLGGMGAGIAHALLTAGFPVTVHNRTAARTVPLQQAGAQVAGSAGEVGAASDVLLLSLSDEPVIEQVLFGELVERLRPGTTVVDTSTVSPSYARATGARLAASGIHRVEACVIGNPDMARAGRLRVFAAGESLAVQEVDDVLGAISQQVRYIGPAGQASALKLAFNLLLGVQTAGLGEAVAFAEGAGLDRQVLLDALEGSGWRSPVLSFRAEFMRRRTYQPAGFRSTLMHKDLRLAQEEGAARGVELPLTGCTIDRFALLVATGRGDQDAAAVAELRLSGVTPDTGVTPETVTTPGVSSR
ncbi:MAG: NAD(P)-dependent oxidoreductase [Pseudonocardiaceae bacterium]